VKKLVAIFFLTIYTATAFGVVVKFHYCDQILTKVSISDPGGKSECDSHSYMPQDCCRDKMICLQINSQRISEQPFILSPRFQNDYADLIPSPSPILITPATPVLNSTLFFHRHQRTLPQTIYLLNRVFRI
jgi:hypothetical protein